MLCCKITLSSEFSSAWLNRPETVAHLREYISRVADPGTVIRFGVIGEGQGEGGGGGGQHIPWGKDATEKKKSSGGRQRRAGKVEKGLAKLRGGWQSGERLAKQRGTNFSV